MKIKVFIVSSFVLVFVLIVTALRVFGTPSISADEQSSEQTRNKIKPILHNEFLYSVEPESDDLIEATEAETIEAETIEVWNTEVPEPVVAQPVEIIPIQELVVAQVDTSVKVEKKVEVVETTREEVVALPSNEVLKLVYGIDVSKWQGQIDWAKVKADGIDFAMIKMGGRSTGDGSLYVDSYFERNIQGALANGIQVGIYFFSQAVTVQEALEEASLTIEYIKKYRITYPVTFDWESADGYRVNNAALDKAALTNIVKVFCDTVAGNGYTPMVYFNRNDWYNAVNGPELTSKYKTWLAVYWSEYIDKSINSKNRYDASTQELPSFKYSYQMWQYTSSGVVNGINGRVDMNIAFFTYSNYKVDKTPIELKVTKTALTVNENVPIDLMFGVSATNSIGYNATSSIKLSVIDHAGNDVSEDVISGDVSSGYKYTFSSPGKYILNYEFADPTGEVKKVVGTLTVRSAPTLVIASKNIEYTYNKEKTESQNHEDLLKILKNNVTSKSSEGTVLTVQVNDVNSKFLTGSYSVIYYVEDGLGLSSTEQIELKINRESQVPQETQAPQETQSTQSTASTQSIASTQSTASTTSTQSTQ